LSFDEQRKTQLCLSVTVGLKLGIEQSAKLFGMSQNTLLKEAYFEYVKNHFKEAMKPVNLTVNQVTVAAKPRCLSKKDLCQIAHCKNVAGDVAGVYGEKEYKLCHDHAGKLEDAKGWVIKYQK
jgi:hypothetical protein